jgi:hypothetical protein
LRRQLSFQSHEFTLRCTIPGPLLCHRAFLRTSLECDGLTELTFRFIPLNWFVIHSIRVALTFLCALPFAGACARGQAATTGVDPTAMSPELKAFLAAQPKWSANLSLEASYGYKDNLLLSSIAEERSAFARGGIEFLLLRIPTGRFEFSVYTEADRTQFFSGKTIDHEAQVWVSTETAYRFGEALRLSVPVTGYYTDRVVDISDTEAERVVAELKETGAMVGPTLRWTRGRFWVEAQAQGQRRYYEERSFNSDVGEGAVRVAWIPREHVELRLTGARRWRDYEGRARYNAAGREIVGTRLKISEREVEGRLVLKWGQAAQWQSTTRVSGSEYRDNGSGYFSYAQKKLAQEVEWAGTGWLVRCSGIAQRIDYDVQTVGFGLQPPARLRDDFSAVVRIERKFTPRWTLFANYEWERSRSNDRFAAYSMNEGLLGARWSWEK